MSAALVAQIREEETSASSKSKARCSRFQIPASVRVNRLRMLLKATSIVHRLENRSRGLSARWAYRPSGLITPSMLPSLKRFTLRAPVANI